MALSLSGTASKCLCLAISHNLGTESSKCAWFSRGQCFQVFMGFVAFHDLR